MSKTETKTVTKTEVVRASEMERVLWDIWTLRNPDAPARQRAALEDYQQRRGRKKEVEAKVPAGDGFFSRKAMGFYTLEKGTPVFNEKPMLTRPGAWGYSGYDRSFGITTHAQQRGLLANPLYNRDIRKERVEEYVAEMKAGGWHDLLSDPITITVDGHVVNGQHRLAALDVVQRNGGIPNDPAFLVVWGASPQEALLADGSRRTARDEKIIAKRVVTA